MARILIAEPDRYVERMLERMLTRLGHEPIATTIPTPEQLWSAEAMLVEPETPLGALIARAASIANPLLPLICASVTPAPPELGVVFAACLIKPFNSGQLAEAIAATQVLADAHPLNR